ncbi:MAG: lipid II flippase MurJ, partial [Mariprofundaceae bacterium]
METITPFPIAGKNLPLCFPRRRGQTAASEETKGRRIMAGDRGKSNQERASGAGRSRLLHATGAIGAWTMLSRVLGFARDVLLARLLGAGALADAFFVAFKLPNFFRRMFAEG